MESYKLESVGTVVFENGMTYPMLERDGKPDIGQGIRLEHVSNDEWWEHLSRDDWATAMDIQHARIEGMSLAAYRQRITDLDEDEEWA